MPSNTKYEKSKLLVQDEKLQIAVPLSEEDSKYLPEDQRCKQICVNAGNLVPEARARVKAAMNSFTPIAQKVCSNRSISTRRRLRLAWSLVMSRLLYNVHVWSCVSGRPRSILNAMYMRVWRRIANDPKYTRTKIEILS